MRSSSWKKELFSMYSSLSSGTVFFAFVTRCFGIALKEVRFASEFVLKFLVRHKLAYSASRV